MIPDFSTVDKVAFAVVDGLITHEYAVEILTGGGWTNADEVLGDLYRTVCAR